MHKVSFATDSMKSFPCLNTIFLFGTENGGCEKTPRQQCSNNMNSMYNLKKPLVGPCVWATYTIAWYVLSQKCFEELRFGQVREDGAGHTGTGYEGHNWLLQTVDTDTDHHVRKKTLHPLWMNRHKHQRKNHAQRTTQTSTSKDSIMHTAQSSFELYQWALQLKTDDLFQNTSMATQYIFMSQCEVATAEI